MFTDVVDRLKNSGRLLLIDEAEHLPYRALELLRRVYDKAGVGILLVGMPRLIFNLRGKRGEYAQLYSRVGFHRELEPLDVTDTEAIVRIMAPGVNGVFKTYHEVSGGNTRLLCKLIRRSQRVAELNAVGISASLIKETAQMLIV
jgi:DNA transposition AAA+ family ATPase